MAIKGKTSMADHRLADGQPMIDRNFLSIETMCSFGFLFGFYIACRLGFLLLSMHP
jgi:hypothetical protein